MLKMNLVEVDSIIMAERKCKKKFGLMCFSECYVKNTIGLPSNGLDGASVEAIAWVDAVNAQV